MFSTTPSRRTPRCPMTSGLAPGARENPGTTGRLTATLASWSGGAIR
ncbi:Hypothetical protein A7982_02002 [Minicystis rosea]|nr:Hypothetical protein A7982_02002 [Minicystis rosea]